MSDHGSLFFRRNMKKKGMAEMKLTTENKRRLIEEAVLSVQSADVAPYKGHTIPGGRKKCRDLSARQKRNAAASYGGVFREEEIEAWLSGMEKQNAVFPGSGDFIRVSSAGRGGFQKEAECTSALFCPCDDLPG